MSFILDALKKSEGDRQRQSGPALFEMKVAAPRSALPPWAVVVSALLLVNLAIVGWVLLKNRTAPPTAATSAALASAEPAARIASPPSAAAAPRADAPALVAPTSAGAMTSSPGAAPAAAAVPAGGGVPSAGPMPSAGSTPSAGPAASSAAGPTLVPPATRAAETANPEDYAPAAETGPPLFSSRVQRGTAEGVPLYQDAAAAPGSQLPQLRLDLHVYSAHAQDRFVMINMRRLREGEALPEGVRVDSITPDGAVLSYNGSRFLLTRD